MSIIRFASVTAAALLAIVGAGSTAEAQTGGLGLEVRPFVGAYIPTGDQRDFLKDAVLVGGQASWSVIPAFAITGTFGWSPTKDRITAGNQTLDIFQYDLGAELRAASWYDGGLITLTPFVGLGAGGRTYSYRDLNVDSKTNFDGYGALGGDVGFGPVALRIEARDYVSQFKPLTGSGDTKTRNDIGLAAGISYRF
jgi:Outer membrane protein beta-barrel domain